MKRILGFAFAALLAGNATAFELTSPDPDVKTGKPMTRAQEYKGFGCNGDNLSPALEWKNVPAGTQSFAVTVYDPDAPTGSGWWHWIVYNIPATATGLPGGAVVKEALPAGAKQGRNDFGERNFGGACPPPGDKPHHYIFTVLRAQGGQAACTGRCQRGADRFQYHEQQAWAGKIDNDLFAIM